MNTEETMLRAVVGKEIKEQLRDFTQEHGCSESEAVRGIIGDWLSSYRWAAPPYDLTTTFERWRRQ